ncbi:DUF397 domain-containing protein [Streptomyces millisiae]|uniref:DUF397 domain-containing protein n=1 Tax=Streptomyces millisiae TaxID=3075542 RepID=A0ABU2LRE4_9ACTN|nr:DUF397 domain-containing protein [Streptomyces sp. DSM 44918]MDT0320166.1 DUF397 domain-containing protein [Streptomyces sp. DSM 44918]
MSNETPELAWFRSSYSDNEGGQCVEVAVEWHRSSHSTNEGGACVEVATCADAVHVRDSKLTDGPRFHTSPAAWSAFLTHARTTTH